MDGCFNYTELKALQELLSPTKEDSEPEDDLPQAGARKLGPGDISVQKEAVPTHTGPHAALASNNDKDIWHPDEVEPGSRWDPRSSDPRATPEYEMKFKQAVTPEDVFLGMSFKSPASASCEWLTLLVKLPGEIREKVELSVESELVDIRSPKYRLHLPTPHSVEPNSSSAKWHESSSTLEISLKLSRELDALNF
ncbi:protein PIH1D3 [Orussus abietinus]|uniref:protein PIH1D3 n=1 Tax=Orussus abietinus TaxID=222816 RepID=UPI000626A305|nr:protein PIH1D3 [Orussus abietinus]